MAIPKTRVASEYLDEAIKLYFDGKFLSALHLAGAAEELMGLLLRRHGETSAIDSLVDGAVRIAAISGQGNPVRRSDVMSLANNAKNRSKHLNEENDEWIDFDPEAAALDMIDRAVSNHLKLSAFREMQLSAQIQLFNERGHLRTFESSVDDL